MAPACSGGVTGPGPYVILEVEDDGVGMDGETQEHLFEPFFTTKGPGKGTGLGLATIYGILHQNSGAVSVESEPGRGSLFRVYLPESLWEDDGSGKVVNPAVEGGRETVLLVEDEPALLELSWVILRRLGYRVLKADRPEKALAIVRSWTGAIDLLVTDVIMPGQNGRELFQSLLPLKPGLKCLFVSGYSEEVLHGKDVLEPGVHLLAKPFSKADLARAVRSVLGGGKD